VEIIYGLQATSHAKDSGNIVQRHYESETRPTIGALRHQEVIEERGKVCRYEAENAATSPDPRRKKNWLATQGWRRARIQGPQQFSRRLDAD
jgi:hypothetical protein